MNSLSEKQPVKTDKTSLSTAKEGSRHKELFFENQLLNYKQAAQYLGISTPYLKRLKRTGQIPYVIVGDRAVRFRVSSLNRWIDEREIK